MGKKPLGVMREMPDPEFNVAVGVVSPDLSPERVKGLQAAPRPPETGDIVLFRIEDTPAVFRPLLVGVVSGEIVTGSVFFCPGDDLYSWPRTYLFARMGRNDFVKHVAGVSRGDAVGQWRSR